MRVGLWVEGREHSTASGPHLCQGHHLTATTCSPGDGSQADTGDAGDAGEVAPPLLTCPTRSPRLGRSRRPSVGGFPSG